MNNKKKKTALEISNEIGFHSNSSDYTKILESEIKRLKAELQDIKIVAIEAKDNPSQSDLDDIIKIVEDALK